MKADKDHGSKTPVVRQSLSLTRYINMLSLLLEICLGQQKCQFLESSLYLKLFLISGLFLKKGKLIVDRLSCQSSIQFALWKVYCVLHVY